jgi:hypothetical protein
MTINVQIGNAERIATLDDPVIVLGAPRSGVRLVATLLAANSAMTSGPQLPFFVTAARGWHDISTKLGPNHDRHYGLDPQVVRAAFERALLSVFAGKASEGPPFRRPLIHSLLAGATLGIFAELFPTAKLLYVVRDVRGVVASLLEQDWSDPRTGARFGYTRDPVAAAEYWKSFNLLAHNHLTMLKKSGRLRIVRYEELCENTERTLGNMAAFLDIAPIAKKVSQQAVQTIAPFDAHIYTPPTAGRIVQTSVSAWREKLTPLQQDAILKRAGAVNAAFGYEPSGAILR